jgi:integrase
MLLPICFPNVWVKFMKLTKVTVQKLMLPLGKSEALFFDEGLPGFGLRIRAGGKRTWIAQYRVGRKQRRVTLGTVETLEADEARKRARAALAKVHLGVDPAIEKTEARAQAAITLGSVAEDYLQRRASYRLKPKSLADVERYLRRHWAPLATLPIRKVTRADVAAQLARIAKENGPFAANRARAAISALFSWAIGEGLVDATPVLGTNKPTEEVSRDRVLSDDELRLIWRHAGEGDYGAIVRLLMLTGQRREEVGGLLWAELDRDKQDSVLWRIGGERTKNGLAHEVPLSGAAVEILKAYDQCGDRQLVFGSRQGPFQGWSNAKSALDARMTKALEGRAFAPWRLHDIRRTVATRLVDLGVQPHIVEAVLNHISGHKAGVAGVYNRAVYSAEKRAALMLWSKHIEKVVMGDE